MEWQEIYKSKLVSAEEAVKQVKSGDMVVPGHNCAEPRYLMKVLCETRGMELENVGILQGLNVGEAPYADPKYHGHFVPVCYFLGKNTRACVQEGRGEFLPMHFYAQPKAMRDKKIGCDVTMLYCTPPDESGYVNLGTCCDQAKACIETARVSICQVNKNMPYLCGDTMVHVCRKLGTECLEVLDYVIPQTDVSKLADGKYQGMTVIGKGGMTGYDEIAKDIVNALLK